MFITIFAQKFYNILCKYLKSKVRIKKTIKFRSSLFKGLRFPKAEPLVRIFKGETLKLSIKYLITDLMHVIILHINLIRMETDWCFMILAIDIGNTNIVMGCVDKSCRVTSLFRIKTDISRTAWQYAAEMYGMLNIFSIDKKSVDGCIISSVVPPLTSSIKQAVSIVFKLEAKVVVPGMKTGLNILIDNPASVGSDMVVDAVAVINQYSVPAVIIDTGTATTFSVVDRNKNYLGGLIMPGVMISQEALTSRTSQLPKISLEAPQKVIGKNTVDCMKSGAVYGNAAMIDGTVDRIENELGEKVTVIATGGLAQSIVPFCKREDIILDNDLLLKGLRILYDKNT